VVSRASSGVLTVTEDVPVTTAGPPERVMVAEAVMVAVPADTPCTQPLETSTVATESLSLAQVIGSPWTRPTKSYTVPESCTESPGRITGAAGVTVIQPSSYCTGADTYSVNAKASTPES
jgi:hypothetical protein